MEDINIDHLAQLARLELSEDEKRRFEKDIPAILEYVGKLAEVNTSDVQTKAYVTDLKNVFVEDEVNSTTGDDRSAVIESFPKKSGDALEVPAVFE